MGNKGMGKGKRLVLHLLQHAVAAVVAICVVVITLNANFMLTYDWGTTNTTVYPWEIEERFEESYIFDNYLREGISNVIRVSVIKNQLETDGAYNGRKKIDIYQYVNRKNNRNLSQNIHAEYYLEDLIKWNEYGFEYQAGEDIDYGYFEAWEESRHDIGATESNIQFKIQEIPEKDVTTIIADEELPEELRQDALRKYSIETAGTDESYNNEVIEQEFNADESTVDTVEAQEAYAVEGEAAAEYSILTERYQTADGKNITDFVDNWEDYREFCRVLQEASDQLSINYREYKFLNENYVADRTNLRYCIQIPTQEGYEYFTNEELNALGTDITEHYRSYGKYLYFYPKHMEYETNTYFEEDFIRSVVNEYEYVYPENTRIWIGVDTAYPVHDSLYYSKVQYESFMPYYIMWLVVTGAAMLIYLALWGYLTVKEGRPFKIGAEGQKATIILGGFDRIPSELVFAAAGVIICAGSIFAYGLTRLVYDINNQILFAGLIAADAFVISAVAMQCYYSMARKLKAHAFWKYTLVGILCRWLLKWIKKGAAMVRRIFSAIRNDRSIVVRTWVLYLLFLTVNAALLLLAFVCLVDGLPVCIVPVLIILAVDAGVGAMQFRENKMRRYIVDGIGEITKGNLNYQLKTERMYGDNLALAEAVNSIGEGIRIAVETSMKDERLKADLITNVSHDIKTPLTSIINYVDLIKRENLKDEKIRGYVEVLDSKSQRLKQLTEDLVEASKISSGNIEYQFEQINFVELIHQTIGEFSEKFEEKNLTVVAQLPEEPMPIQADSRRIWRVIENLYNNIYKYAMPGTRVYLDMCRQDKDGRGYAVFAVKNISAQPLNIGADELTERFIRGDVSRSTEGSGLGLSIAKNLTKAQHGEFTIYLDGDLFKVILEFPLE